MNEESSNNYYSTLPIRYIRDWLNGSNKNTYNHWVEIQAIDSQGNNVALNRPVSASIAVSSSELQKITDESLVTANYASVGNGHPGSVTVDLGSEICLDSIKVWHYYGDSRVYYGTKTQVSADGVNWYTIFDSSIEGTYTETSGGKVIDLTVKEIGEPKIYLNNIEIRYIRDWTNGNSMNGGNHWTEIQAFDSQWNNVAQYKKVESFPVVDDASRPLSRVVDGQYGNTDGWTYTKGGDCYSYVQVELDEPTTLEQIKVWHYYGDARQYYGTKTEVSADGVNWYTVFDSMYLGEYTESSTGKIHIMSDVVAKFDRIENQRVDLHFSDENTPKRILSGAGFSFQDGDVILDANTTTQNAITFDNLNFGEEIVLTIDCTLIKDYKGLGHFGAFLASSDVNMSGYRLCFHNSNFVISRWRRGVETAIKTFPLESKVNDGESKTIKIYFNYITCEGKVEIDGVQVGKWKDNRVHYKMGKFGLFGYGCKVKFSACNYSNIALPQYSELDEKPITIEYEDQDGVFNLITSDREIYLIEDEEEGLTFSTRRDTFLTEGMDMYTWDMIEEKWCNVEKIILSNDYKPFLYKTNFKLLTPSKETFVDYVMLKKYDFKMEDMDNLSFNTDSWYVTTYDSSNCLRNNSIGHSGNTEFTVTRKTNKIKFKYRVRSESSYDYFRFYIDGTEVIKASGNGSWTTFERNLSEATHTFRFRYHKDGSGVSYEDAIFIKDIEWFIENPAPTYDEIEVKDFFTMYQREDNSYCIITSNKPYFILENDESGKFIWSSSDSDEEYNFDVYKNFNGSWLVEHYHKDITIEPSFNSDVVVSNQNILLPNLNWFNTLGSKNGEIPSTEEVEMKRYYIIFADHENTFTLITSSNPFYIIEDEGRWKFSSSKDELIKEYDHYTYVDNEWQANDDIRVNQYKLYYPINASGNIDIETPNIIMFYGKDINTPPPIDSKFLVIDDGKIFSHNGEEYIAVGEGEPSQDDFLYRGMDTIPKNTSTILSPNAKLLYYSEIKELPREFPLNIYAVPKMQKIIRKEPFVFEEDQQVNRCKIYSTEQTDGKIYYAITTDNRETYKTFYNGQWVEINIEDDNEIRTKAMSKSAIEGITKEKWVELSPIESMNIVVFLEQNVIADVATISKFHVFYEE